MPGNAGGEVAAAIGKERHRGVVVAEIGVAHKRAMLFGEHVIDATVKLVLVVWLDPGEYIVVCRGGIGRRIMLQYLRRDRVEPVHRDLIVGEGHARGGCRIVNCRGEHATALCHRGTTLWRVIPVRSRVPCQSAKKNVLFLRTGPPTVRPYWFLRNSGRRPGCAK